MPRTSGVADGVTFGIGVVVPAVMTRLAAPGHRTKFPAHKPVWTWAQGRELLDDPGRAVFVLIFVLAVEAGTAASAVTGISKWRRRG